MKKELLIYLGIIVFLTVTIHYKELMAHPIEHILNLPNSGAYGLGIIHPLIFSMVVYILVFIPRFISKLLKSKK